MVQDRPICFQCVEPIRTNAEMVFEAPCGHSDCRSAVFHALCLFEWRDLRAQIDTWFQEMRDRWLEEHGVRQETEERS